VAVARLGKRIYRDRLERQADEHGLRRYSIYNDAPSYHEEEGTDFHAVAEGKISLTPIHLDLTSSTAIAELERWALEQ
jgi:5'-nucleotidase